MYSYIIRYELFYCYMFILLLLAVMAVEAKTSAVILSLRKMVIRDSIMVILVKCLIFTVLMFAVVGMAAHALGLDNED